jgi:RHS repeat-associated protein
VTYAREFRYDGARARYLNRTLDPVAFKIGSIAELDAVWTDYDGDEVYGDYRVTPGYPPTIGPLAEYEPGVWRKVGGVPDYLHNDHLGTLRQTTGTTGSAGTGRVFTAFGERLPGSATDRFGYVGAWGYQSTPIPESQNPDTAFPYLHVGHRYYDPSSGRFLQRDPIGIGGGTNVFSYVDSDSTSDIDPLGLKVLLGGNQRIRIGREGGPPVHQDPPPSQPSTGPTLGDRIIGAAKGGVITGVTGGVVNGIKGGITGGMAGAVAGGVGVGPGVVAGTLAGALWGTLEGFFVGTCAGFMFP